MPLSTRQQGAAEVPKPRPEPTRSATAGARLESWGECGNGWLAATGWMPDAGIAAPGAAQGIVHFRGGSAGGRLLLGIGAPGMRRGLAGHSFVVAIAGVAVRADLVAMDIWDGSQAHRLPGEDAAHVAADVIRVLARAILATSGAAPEDRAEIAAALAEPQQRPAVDVADLMLRIRLEIEGSFTIQPDGLLLQGWLLDPTEGIAELRLRSGDRVTPLSRERRLPIRRRDLVESVAVPQGIDDPHLGFLAYFPAALTPGAPSFLEIETRGGELARYPIPAPGYAAGAAIRRILGAVDLPHGDVAPLFDNVLGPVIRGLNRQRLALPVTFDERIFGVPEREPLCCIVVPLYGRIDFMTHQLSQFAEAPPCRCEIVYVLDDPRLRAEAEQLAASLHARFGIAFRLLLLSRNVGFAPAMNLGVAASRAPYLCLLNSDVFATEAGWLEHLVLRLQADAGLGVVAPVLLFEDGTLQHGGCRMLPREEFSGWRFPQHEGKGRKPAAATGLAPAEAVTGACMVLSRLVWTQARGFDEDYPFGDFEDADLCMKLAEQGLRCGVDQDVRLYHLERQSQSRGGRWRQHLTVFGAWLFQMRWRHRFAVAA
ncbi:glycosyltransferase family 2 protein [Falsiroseomonas sp. HC035]|uniref:glycosyltransferase family 2 protein n=1 Tax=Falsiroseomonas sp. HC035 TaxID=3390999 RepID=UPI003D31716E